MRKDAVALLRLPRDTSGAKQLCLGRTPPRAAGLAQGRAGNTARSAEAPQFESRRRRCLPRPQRPPASRPTGLTSVPAAQLTAPLRRAALTRPHARRGRGAAGIRGRSLPPPLPLPRASWAGPSRPAARARALARSSGGSAGSQVSAAGPRLHLAHRALFLCPNRKAKTIGAAQAREGNGKQEGRRRRVVTLASGSELTGLPPGGQSACAERGRGGHPASKPGKSGSQSSLQRHSDFWAAAVVRL